MTRTASFGWLTLATTVSPNTKTQLVDTQCNVHHTFLVFGYRSYLTTVLACIDVALS